MTVRKADYHDLMIYKIFSRMHTTLSHYVGPSIGWSVGRLVGPLVTHLFFWHFLGSFCITAPAQLHVTDSAMYTALFSQNLLLSILKKLELSP